MEAKSGAAESAGFTGSWSRFWRYQILVLREAGWPPARDWIISIAVGLITGAGLKSWLPSLAAGIAAGLGIYCFDLARASVRIHTLQERELARFASRRSPCREAEAVLRRFGGLRVDFDKPSKHDLGSLRPAFTWNKKFEDLESSLPALEMAASNVTEPWREEYLDICQEIRDILSQQVQPPEGKSHYLSLSRSGVMQRLADLVKRDC